MEKRKKKKSATVIGGPTSFKHERHVGINKVDDIDSFLASLERKTGAQNESIEWLDAFINEKPPHSEFSAWFTRQVPPNSLTRCAP